MPKALTLEVVKPALNAAQLGGIAGQIRATHALARTHAQLAIAFAVRCGHLCEQAKAALPHGKFDAWLDEQGIPKATAHRNRQLAKSSTMELLPAADLTAPDFLTRVESDKGFRETLAAKVHEVAGESTVTDVMKDLGIIKEHANVDAATGKRVHYPEKKQKLTPEQLAKVNRAAGLARVRTALAALKAALDDKQLRRWLEPKDWLDLQRLAQDRLDQFAKLAGLAAVAAKKGLPCEASAKKGGRA